MFYREWLMDLCLLGLVGLVVMLPLCLLPPIFGPASTLTLGTAAQQPAVVVDWVFTGLPCLLLILLGTPSLSVLYALQNSGGPSVNLRVTGHQWYWSYDYLGCGLTIDAFLHGDTLAQPRLLGTDSMVLAPRGSSELCVAAADVLHSGAVPPAGIKVDACPGRLCRATLNVVVGGHLYGHCSELCGVNHSFMPVAIEVVPTRLFKAGVLSFQ